MDSEFVKGSVFYMEDNDMKLITSKDEYYALYLLITEKKTVIFGTIFLLVPQIHQSFKSNLAHLCPKDLT